MAGEDGSYACARYRQRRSDTRAVGRPDAAVWYGLGLHGLGVYDYEGAAPSEPWVHL